MHCKSRIINKNKNKNCFSEETSEAQSEKKSDESQVSIYASISWSGVWQQKYGSLHTITPEKMYRGWHFCSRYQSRSRFMYIRLTNTKMDLSEPPSASCQEFNQSEKPFFWKNNLYNPLQDATCTAATVLTAQGKYLPYSTFNGKIFHILQEGTRQISSSLGELVRNLVKAIIAN